MHEHLPDTVDCLMRCRTWLKDDGVLIIEVPNIASAHQHPDKRFHAAHLFGFTPETLQFAAKQTGFLPVHMQLDQYERNILAVFRKSAEPDPGTTAVHPDLDPIRGKSVARYYLMPQTYVRFFDRMRQFGDEITGTWGRRTAKEVLNSLLKIETHT